MTTTEILNLLPYSPPFLFADELCEISDDGVKGTYTYKPDEFFYQGHFTNFPITPGVILTETMAQIGAVCLGIYLFRDQMHGPEIPQIALPSVEINFHAPEPALSAPAGYLIYQQGNSLYPGPSKCPILTTLLVYEYQIQV